MWEFYVLIILIVIFIYLIYTIISVPLALINISIIILVAMGISKDIKEKKRQLYYLISAFLTALFFIFRDKGILSFFSQILKKHYILEYTYAVILIFVFAQLVAFIHQELIRIKNKKSKD